MPWEGSSSFVRFFFSSRRRHTRWTGDWSSDVCSSDLVWGAARESARSRQTFGESAHFHGRPPKLQKRGVGLRDVQDSHRSEERRVGKVWSTWSCVDRREEKEERMLDNRYIS